METRDRLKDWLRRLLAERGESARALAQQAGIAASTLNRFLNDPTYQGTLTTTTIDKIVAVTGRRPEDARPPGLAENDAEPYAAEAPKAPFSLPPGADIWRVTGRALELAGYRPGDFMVVDGHASPRAGDVVCAQVVDAERGDARTVLRQYLPPYLVTATAAALQETPIPVDPDTVTIMGVVTASWRLRPDA